MNAKNNRTYAQLRSDSLAVNVIFNDPLLYTRQLEDGTVEVTLRSGAGQDPYSLKKYTYKALIEQGIKPGDVVTVTVTNGQIKLATVVEIFSIAQIKAGEHKWVLGRVQTEFAQRILEQEAKFSGLLEEAQAATERTEALKKLIPALGDAVPALAQLDGMQDIGKLLPAPAAVES